ncbi:MAG: multidrug efflux SMR transporter [Capnocytophaga sp.]|nr:multidrug efflux SMR transporter [Capnocytophaga sp.]
MHYIYLALAIILEVTATAFMVKSEGFTKVTPTIIFITLFIGCFYFLTQALKVLPLGIAYAIWGGVGIILTTLVGVFIFKQKIDLPAVLGIACIVLGVVIINAFSKVSGH